MVSGYNIFTDRGIWLKFYYHIPRTLKNKATFLLFYYYFNKISISIFPNSKQGCTINFLVYSIIT